MSEKSILAQTLDEMISVLRGRGLTPGAAQIVHINAEGAQTRIVVEIADVEEPDEEQRPERTH